MDPMAAFLGAATDEEQAYVLPVPPPFPPVDPAAVLAEREPETWEREPTQTLPRPEYLSLHRQAQEGKGADTHVDADSERPWRVYRCRVCAVRVADEVDIVSRDDAETLGELRFSRVRNIDAASGTCVRCGTALRPPSAKDPCTLRMYVGGAGTSALGANDLDADALGASGLAAGAADASDVEVEHAHEDGEEQAFALTPVRVLVYLELKQSDICRGLYEVDPKTDDFYEDERVVHTPFENSFAVVNALRGPMFAELLPHHAIDVDIRVAGNSIHTSVTSWLTPEDKAPFHRIFEERGFANFYKHHSVKALTDEMPTFTTTDLAVVITATDSEHEMLRWTGVNARLHEPLLAEAWRASGGNVVFGNWHMPYFSDTFIDEASLIKEMRGELWRYSEGLPNKHFRRMRENNGEDYEMWTSNNQRAFADLAERGHYLWFWPFDSPTFPDEAKARIALALKGDLFADGQWRGLVELPKGFFEPQDRGPHYDLPPDSRPLFDYTDPTFK